ncbi:hypothetical protein S4A8_06638 [Salinisphaera sp. S4-8]|uniref:hypothetical protein n=1 Tax=Salinisphaera sp. S4-8 TaxID=633357 RepID=UPI0033403A3B
MSSFGNGLGQAAMQPLINSQPQWITIAPRLKEECFAESNGVINATFVRCRRGPGADAVRCGGESRGVE